jgi:phenylacetic acid degradation operon negative regulatory protein
VYVEADINQQEVRPGLFMVDLLGDFQRAGGTEIRLKALVALGELLGIPGPTMRVTLARFRERGWFDVRRDGRESIYRLSSSAQITLHEGGRRIHRPPLEAWSGDWSTVIYTVPESDRQTRDDLRKQLIWLGFGPLAPATWIRPQPQLDDVANAAAKLPSARLTLLTSRTSGLAADRALVARCWDLDALVSDYEQFVRQTRLDLPRYERVSLTPGDAFVERTRLVHRYRTLTRNDPQFPVELQPAGWPGEEARQLFERSHALLSVPAEELYREVVLA